MPPKKKKHQKESNELVLNQLNLTSLRMEIWRPSPRVNQLDDSFELVMYEMTNGSVNLDADRLACF